MRRCIADGNIPTLTMRTADLHKPLRIRSCGCLTQAMRKRHVWAQRQRSQRQS
jgi:hypothetical protein